MDYFPIFLKLADRTALVVGGGDVASRKIALLRQAGAHIRVVAMELNAALAEDVAAGRIDYRAGRFAATDLDGIVLVVAATDDRAVNRDVATAATGRQIPVNVVDDPALCSFIMPAIVDRGSIVAAVSTGGASPVLARLIRARLELALPERVERLAELARAWRVRVKTALPDLARRRRFWERVLGDLFASGGEPSLDALLEGEAASSGKLDRIVVDIAAPDLLSLRDYRLIQSADLILYDPVIPSALLDYSRRDAQKRAVPGLAATVAEEAADAIARADRVVALLPATAA